MLRYSLRRAAASTTAGGFSSAAFTNEDGGAYASLKSEQERLQRQNQSGSGGAADGEDARSPLHSSSSSGSGHDSSQEASAESGAPTGSSRFSSSSSSSFSTSSAFMGKASDTALERPTIDTYKAMTDAQLVETLRVREEQIAQLRTIYENFHYEADKHFRKMIFDYHDKTMQLSQVHGKMQQASLQINREALARMRDEQDRMTRDKILIFTLCTIWSVVFWIWVRRHYVMKRELSQQQFTVGEREQMGPTVTGIGSYGNNFFGSNKRNARFSETSWEREVRERREAQDLRDRQLALVRHQSEVEKIVAARDGGAEASNATGKSA